MRRQIALVVTLLVIMLAVSYALFPRSFQLSTSSSPFQNGGFESGSLSPWVAIGSGMSVSTAHVHSGTYSSFFNVGATDVIAVKQTFAPVSLPVTVSAYFYNVQYPAAYTSCSHPYTQWAIYDTAGHVLEAGFSGQQIGVSSGQAWLVPYTGYNNAWLSPRPTNQWIELKVEISQTQLRFYVDGAEVSLRPQPNNPWMFSSVQSIQLIASCTAMVYVDDVQVGGSNPTGAIYYVKDNANNRYQVANGGSARVIPPVSFEVNTGNVQNIQGVRVTIDGSPYAMTSEGSSMYGSASIPLSAGSHTVQFQYLTGTTWTVLGMMTLNGGDESSTDQGIYLVMIGILIAAIALVIYKRRRA